MIGEGVYDSEGHRNAQFLEATDVGPYPNQYRKAWTTTRDEAMENLEVRDDPEQEGWERMGPLAEPTPAYVMNRGAAERRQRRGEEYRIGNEEGNAANAAEATRAEVRRERPETEEHNEMYEIREALAEALQEMETETVQQECGMNEADG